MDEFQKQLKELLDKYLFKNSDDLKRDHLLNVGYIVGHATKLEKLVYEYNLLMLRDNAFILNKLNSFHNQIDVCKGFNDSDLPSVLIEYLEIVKVIRNAYAHNDKIEQKTQQYIMKIESAIGELKTESKIANIVLFIKSICILFEGFLIAKKQIFNYQLNNDELEKKELEFYRKFFEK